MTSILSDRQRALGNDPTPEFATVGIGEPCETCWTNPPAADTPLTAPELRGIALALLDQADRLDALREDT